MAHDFWGFESIPVGVKVLGARSIRRQHYLIDGTQVPGRALLGHKLATSRAGAARRHQSGTDTAQEREYPSVGTAMIRADQLSPLPVAKPVDPNA